MKKDVLFESLEKNPVIAAVHEKEIDEAIQSPTEIIFLLKGNLLTIKSIIDKVKNSNKLIFVHIDLADGIGKDRVGLEYISKCGADGIISTRGNIIRQAKDMGLLTVQRFFALDSKGVDSIFDMLSTTSPDLIEIMPGVIGKIINSFANENVPLISGGLIETKSEITNALNLGAIAVSTSKKELWYM